MSFSVSQILSSINFPLVLTMLTVMAGLITLIDVLYFNKHRPVVRNKKGEIQYPFFVEQARSLFWVLLFVWFLRSFIVQPFYTPTGSLEPTLLPGELSLVDQYAYGVYFPVWRFKLLHTGTPQRGDIAVFHWPVNPRSDFIKRVVGVPGDLISYIDKVFYINGKKMSQRYIGETVDSDDLNTDSWPVDIYEEDLNGIKHKIYRAPSRRSIDFYNLRVPPGMYFMVGDNRDDSDDSRSWGFVPEANFLGKAHRVWMSWDSAQSKVRWHRLGAKL